VDVGHGSRLQNAGMRMRMVIVAMVMKAGVTGVAMVAAASPVMAVVDVMLMVGVAPRVRMPKIWRRDTTEQHGGCQQ